ncbi:M20 family metallo-hydrolase [Micromonospora sp. HNM0581]|uniref:amidohydrolase n=1 Tax=Micromonospora sp. HNM0581 TaxID=2716341 RepID=UPI00146A5C19|nr:M20 family metallo-hydrolase [Micromonospora sp. HNM0581]
MNDEVTTRRAVHSVPEPGFGEYQTTCLIAARLGELGADIGLGCEILVPELRMGIPDDVDRRWQQALDDGCDPEIMAALVGGLTGVVGTFHGQRPGRVVAVRADIDALPLTESDSDDHLPHRLGFASTRPTAMHACGHDGNTAIVLGLARRLADRNFAGTIKLLFQPAEEGLRGGRAMAASGVLDDVDDLICIHLGLGAATGTVYPRTDGALASVKLRATFTGIAAHAGLAPERGRSALLAAAAAALSVHSVGQHGRATTRVNVGALHCPGGSNIVPATATLLLEARADDTEACDLLVTRITAALQGSATAYGVTCALETVGQAPAVRCDADLAARVAEAARQVSSVTRVGDSLTDRASDDAAWLLDRVRTHGGRGTYVVIGSDLAGGHHEPSFDFDESALRIGVDLLDRVVRTLGEP